MMNNTTITFTACTIGYGDYVVLRDIDAQLPAGKISVILGGSGSGKSTLLRHIVGLSRPLSGTMHIGDDDVFSLAPAQFRRLRRRMGMLFQDGALLGALRLIDNVALPLHEHTSLSPKLIHEAAMRTLRLVGLAEFADFYPSQLSGGMRKRAGLARAIITEPPILLCDEPTSGLDPLTAAQMDQLLLDMHQTFPQMTLVVVSHDLASLERIADHVLVLHEGRAVFCGPYADLVASEDAYLRSFLQRKTTPINMGAPQAQDSQVRAALDTWMQQ